MMRRRNAGTLVAVGGLTAAIALLTGLPNAGAQEAANAQTNVQPSAVSYTQSTSDQLTQLRANQQLLQQRIDQLAAVGAAPVRPGTPTIAGSFPRSFLIPGTNTSIRISGFAALDVLYFMGGGPKSFTGSSDVGEFGQVLNIPVGPGHGDSPHTFGMTPHKSRIRVETRTPTAWGPAGTVIEFDFNGGSYGLHPGDSLKPRLRLAYGTLGPWIAGQDYSLTFDGQSHIDVIDFGGDVFSDTTVRVPQLRYTYQAGGGMAWAGSIEAPDTDAIAPGLTGGPNHGQDSVGAGRPLTNPAPDLVGAFIWHQPWGHINLRAAIRDMDFNNPGGTTRSYIGYGGWFSGSVLPGWGDAGRDFLGWGVGAGDGMGRYMGDALGLDSNYGAPGVTEANLVVKPVTVYGGHVGYKHWWAHSWASDISFGIAHADYHGILLGPTVSDEANRELITAHANLFYYPVSFIHVGIEYMYGHRQVVDHHSGNLNVLLGEVMVKF